MKFLFKLLRKATTYAAQKNSNVSFNSFLPQLKEKWQEIPAGLQLKMFSSDFLKMNKKKFFCFWESLYKENCEGKGYQVRGWYHELYAPLANLGGRWLEVGSGLGFDGTFFAKNGAQVTFCDIIEDNLKVVERVCKIQKIKNADFKLLTKISEIKEYSTFDVLLAVGSLINNPYEIAKKERKELFNRLRNGGRWLELTYPRERWIADGCPAPQEWGKMTDGDRTPWMEWYDLDKLLKCFPSRSCSPILSFNFYNNEFNWFDLIKCRRP